MRGLLSTMPASLINGVWNGGTAECRGNNKSPPPSPQRPTHSNLMSKRRDTSPQRKSAAHPTTRGGKHRRKESILAPSPSAASREGKHPCSFLWYLWCTATLLVGTTTSVSEIRVVEVVSVVDYGWCFKQSLTTAGPMPGPRKQSLTTNGPFSLNFKLAPPACYKRKKNWKNKQPGGYMLCMKLRI